MLRLRNVVWSLHSYFHQFRPAVADRLVAQTAPVRKELADFVRLAKWEDRGYYALRVAVEKAHRKLHQLTAKTKRALQEPLLPWFGLWHKQLGYGSVEVLGGEDQPPKEGQTSVAPLHRDAGNRATNRDSVTKDAREDAA